MMRDYHLQVATYVLSIVIIFYSNNLIDDSSGDEKPLKSICDIEIPSQYLIPEFTDKGTEKDVDQLDIFRFGSYSIKEFWERTIKSSLRQRSEPLKSDRYRVFLCTAIMFM